MSKSLLYHAFGIREYNYVRTQYHTGNIIFSIERKPFTNRCPCCKSKDVIRHGAIRQIATATVLAFPWSTPQDIALNRRPTIPSIVSIKVSSPQGRPVIEFFRILSTNTLSSFSLKYPFLLRDNKVSLLTIKTHHSFPE